MPVVDTISRRIDYAPPRPDDVGPLIRAGLLSHRFISIHPFPDGNGRCGRLLASASLWRSGDAFRGFLSFEEWFAADRESYYAALQLGCPVDFYEGQHDPDHTPWLSYFSQVMRQAAVALSTRAERLQARQGPPDPHSWEGLDRRSQQLLTRLRARVAAGESDAAQFRPGDLEDWFAVSPTTGQEWLRMWQDQGLLEPARPGQRIRAWQLRQPWQRWVLDQPQRQE